MAGNNEEDYLDSLLDSVSIVKDDVVGDEMFDEDTNELIGMLNQIMTDVDDYEIAEDVADDISGNVPKENISDNDILGAAESSEVSEVDFSKLEVDDEMRTLLGENENNAGSQEFSATELTDEQIARLSQLDAEHAQGMIGGLEDMENMAGPDMELDDELESIEGLDTITEEEPKKEPKKDKSAKKAKKANNNNPKGLAAFFAGLFGSGKKDKGTNAVADESSNENVTDENARVMNEVFDENGELIEGGKSGKTPKKKSFFSSLFSSRDKNSSSKKTVTTEEDSEDSFENEDTVPKKEKVKKEKKAKKESKQKDNKKDAKKKSVQKQKEKKVKPKKEKVAPNPSELVQVTPGGVFAILVIVAGISAFVYIGINTYIYMNDIEKATEYLLLHNYDKAFSVVEGMEMKTEEDELLYEQIATIMVVQKQYHSYLNYTKLSMEYEALDSLIKGVGRYYEFAAQGEELGVLTDMTAAKDNLVSVLEENYGINEALAVTYSEIEDVIQYYYIVNSYGGQSE